MPRNYIASRKVLRQDLELQLQERLSERVAGRILLRQANLNDFQRELLALKDHSQLLTFDQVAAFLRPLDRPELLAQAAEAELGAQGAKHFAVVNQFDGNFIEDEEEHAEQFLEDEESESLQEDELYFEDREYDEEAAMFISAYHSAYADIRRDLKDRRKERGYVRHKGPSSSSFRDRDRGKGKGKRSERSKSRPDSGRAYRRSYNKVSDQRMLKGNPSDLQARVRCFNCNELGR